jgi:hypothetical protein
MKICDLIEAADAPSDKRTDISALRFAARASNSAAMFVDAISSSTDTAPLHELEVGSRLLHRHARLEAAVATHPKIAALQHERFVHRRREQVDVAIGKAERLGHHADDRNRLLADAHYPL